MKTMISIFGMFIFSWLWVIEGNILRQLWDILFGFWKKSGIEIEINAYQPDNTLIKFAISLDNKNTHLIYQSNSWVTINESDIIINGNTFDELNALQPIDFNDLNFTNKTLDIIVVMKTLDENITPSIKSIKVSSLIEE